MAARRNRSSFNRRSGGRMLESLESRLLMAAHVWTGAVNNLWSEAGNWTGGAPVVGEADCDLEFPDGAANPATINDIAGGGLSIRNLVISGKGSNGNDYALLLTNGFSLFGSISVTAAAVSPTIGASAILMQVNSTVDVAATSSLTISAAINGFNSLTKTGEGLLALTGANNYHGGTAISAGTLTITLATSLGTSTVDVASGATLNLAGAGLSKTLNLQISIAGNGQASAGAIALNGNVDWSLTNDVTLSADARVSIGTGRKLTISGDLLGADDLVQAGAGTLDLTGGGTFSGMLTTSGTTKISSTLANMAVFANGGHVTGTGVVGSLTVAGAGDVSPAGAGTIGTLTAGGGMSLEADGTGLFEIDNTGSDAITVTGEVSLAGTLSLSLLDSFVPDIGTEYVLISNDDVDAVVGTFAGLDEGDTFVLGGKTYAVSYVGGDGNDVSVTRVQVTVYAVGSDAGTVATVKIYSADGTLLFGNIRPFGNTFKGGVTVATGDLDGDGTMEIIAAPLAGTVPVVRIFSSETGAELSNFNPAYAAAYRGGLYVAVGDINGDGNDDIVVSPKSGQNGLVKVFDGTDNSALGTPFKAYSAAYGGGVRVAAGDVDGDGNADIITAPGNATFKTIKVFSGADYTQVLETFTPYLNVRNVAVGFGAGMFVAAGDFNGDGKADIVVAPGSGGKGTVKVFDAANVEAAPLGTILTPYTATWAYGVRVAAIDVNNDGTSDLLTVPGATGKSALKIWDGTDFTTLLNGSPIRIFAAPYNGGGFVG